jgi:hypothetical protein
LEQYVYKKFAMTPKIEKIDVKTLEIERKYRMKEAKNRKKFVRKDEKSGKGFPINQV